MTAHRLLLTAHSSRFTPMIFKETKLKGAFIIELEPIEDNRGFFSRSFCKKEFALHGISMDIAQCNISYNKKRGTLRGMHYQTAPYEEAKLIRCIRGSIYDVIIDLRRDSPTYCQWVAVELSEVRHRMLYVPKGFAQGFLTLEDHTEVFYHMSEFYAPGYGRGVRWNDPTFGIHWPEEITIMSDQDKSFSDFIP